MKNIRSVVAIVLLALAAPAFAQAPAPPAPAAPVAWASLSVEQQRLLAPYSAQWQGMPAERQAALARGSQRWLAMPPDQRAAARERFQQWRALPPERRALLRERLERFRALPPEQQREVRENFHRFQSLPPERRAMLRQRWQRATPAERAEDARPHARAARASDDGAAQGLTRQGRVRTTSGTLQTSMRPAGTLYHSSRRFRRLSTRSENVCVSVRMTSSCERCDSGTSCGELQRLDGGALGGLLVKAERPGTAPQRRQELDPGTTRPTSVTLRSSCRGAWPITAYSSVPPPLSTSLSRPAPTIA